MSSTSAKKERKNNGSIASVVVQSDVKINAATLQEASVRSSRRAFVACCLPMVCSRYWLCSNRVHLPLQWGQAWSAAPAIKNAYFSTSLLASSCHHSGTTPVVGGGGGSSSIASLLGEAACTAEAAAATAAATPADNRCWGSCYGWLVSDSVSKICPTLQIIFFTFLRPA